MSPLSFIRNPELIPNFSGTTIRIHSLTNSSLYDPYSPGWVNCFFSLSQKIFLVSTKELRKFLKFWIVKLCIISFMFYLHFPRKNNRHQVIKILHERQKESTRSIHPTGELQSTKYDSFDRIDKIITILKNREILLRSHLKILLILSKKRLCNSPDSSYHFFPLSAISAPLVAPIRADWCALIYEGRKE